MHSERTDKDEEAIEGSVTRMSAPVNICRIPLAYGSVEEALKTLRL